jgi:hypothetical protein
MHKLGHVDESAIVPIIPYLRSQSKENIINSKEKHYKEDQEGNSQSDTLKQIQGSSIETKD